VGRHFPDALDQLSELFLKGGLLVPLAGLAAAEACQEDGCCDLTVSNCEHKQ